jgi:integrase
MASHVIEAASLCAPSHLSLYTRYNRLGALRRMLRALWEEEGCEKLDGHVPISSRPRPRAVIASEDEMAELKSHAPDDLRLFIVLCSDLAIRSGTAVKISPAQYDRIRGTLRFSTKKGARVALPVTGELTELFNLCDLRNPEPFLTQIRKRLRPHCRFQMKGLVVKAATFRAELKKLALSLGITRKLVPHDMRRTTAVAYYKLTRNLRKVQTLLGHSSLQATIWYLDNDLEDVDLADLETIKRPFLVRKEKIA